MNKMVNVPDQQDKKRVVIIGGGFGGLKLASSLNSKYFQIILLDKNNYYQFQPLFYQVAIAGLEPSSISYPYRKNFQNKKSFIFRMCEATKVIPEENMVETNMGSISYDYLVIANGCDTNFFGKNELKDSTISLKSVSEALFARNRILQSFEDATVTSNEEKLKELLTFVIVGGGATGVELAGALADMRNFVLPKDYPDIDFSKMQIHLIDASPRLLAAMSEHASEIAAKTLKKRGVIIHQDVSVSSYENNLIVASDGSELVTKNVLWVAGVSANGMNGFEPSCYGRGKRLIVNEYCQINGFKNVFAIGDAAYMETKDYPHGHPQVAQGAIQMAKTLSDNLEAWVKGKEAKPFKYKDKGSLATIGRNAAVADLHQFRFGGRIAWWLWLLVHISTIIGVKNKLFIFLDWAWSYVTYDVSLRLLIRPKTSSTKN